MAIIPVIRCSHFGASVAFYTRVLDFQWLDGDREFTDPCHGILQREGAALFLSSYPGDGEYGQAVVVATDDVDALARKFRERGLRTPGDPGAPREVHEGPLDQTWGTREFYVDDPDGNTIRFVQGLAL
jgi:catechol 2,3-dioxygenase-like lactoylglutathione lyase family enzyme